MRDKNYLFVPEGDIAEIECTVCDAAVIVRRGDGALSVELPAAGNVCAGSDGDTLVISQGKRKLFAARQTLTVSVPEHVVPALRLCGKRFDVRVDGGIFGGLTVRSEGGSANFCDCSFESAEIIGGDICTGFTGCTVKGALTLRLDEGSLIAENTFATRAECRLHGGNIGVVDMDCRECVFETERGNISVTLKGAEEDYSYAVATKVGTANRDKAARSGAERSANIYAGNGNVVLDFTDESKSAKDSAGEAADDTVGGEV